jgi:hypothetical protein
MAISGVFHIHSDYSHDGKNSINDIAMVLEKKGFSFFVLSDHFNDFDEKKFNEYKLEIDEINRKGTIIIIPGIEVELNDFHIVLIPVENYSKIKQFIENGSINGFPLRIVVHPSKNSFKDFKKLTDKYSLNGFELWNQRKDGSFFPPVKFIKKIDDGNFSSYLKLFGVDLHNIKHPINNVISVKSLKKSDLNADLIIDRLKTGDFINLNNKIDLKIGGYSSDLKYFKNIKLVYRIYGCLYRVVSFILGKIYLFIPRNKRKKIDFLKNKIIRFS